MPEGDSLARAARRLGAVLDGKELTRGELRWPTLAEVDLAGAVVHRTLSYGKNLLMRLEDGRTLHTHLRMDGRWRVYALGALGSRRPEGHPDARCVFATDAHLVVGLTLGMMTLVPPREEHRVIGHLGPDLLAAELDVAEAGRRIRATDRPIGEVLLDQRVVAGIGTIYLAETLWRLRIHPLTSAADLGTSADDIAATAAALLQRSVDAPWPTATGHAPRGPAGAQDDAIDHLSTYVHGRRGKACLRCGTGIERIEVGPPAQQRPAFYCPQCQPAPPLPGHSADDRTSPR